MKAGMKLLSDTSVQERTKETQITVTTSSLYLYADTALTSDPPCWLQSAIVFTAGRAVKKKNHTIRRTEISATTGP